MVAEYFTTLVKYPLPQRASRGAAGELTAELPRRPCTGS